MDGVNWCETWCVHGARKARVLVGQEGPKVVKEGICGR